MKNCPTCQTPYPNNFQVCPQDGASLVEFGMWADGAVIRGKYRILGKVGQGGMGAVYKVMHVAFDELHALKVINPSLMGDELFVKRFRHEAVITRKLRHPNAVRVDDIDEAEDGRPIILMEYIEGQSLKKLIQDQGALPVPRVCSIIKQAAAALEAAHNLGMIHRDIKPENIVLVAGPEGEVVKVLDFGIAKVKEARASESAGMTLTGTGVVIGTPQYMSPEQAMGKRGDELDGRSDIYSLGVVMYQMLTGDLPFKADTTMAMLLAHMQTPPTPIRTIHPELQIPDAVANVVMKTLEKDPSLRPQSARALITEIENAEKRAAPLNETRVLNSSGSYSPEDSARRLREALQTPKPRAAQRPVPGGIGERPLAPVVSVPAPQPARATPPAAATPRPAPAKVEPPPMFRAAEPKKSRTGLWVAMGVLVILLVGGGLYVISRNLPTEPANLSSSPTATPGGTPVERTSAGSTGNEGKTELPNAAGSPSASETAKPGSQPEAQQLNQGTSPNLANTSETHVQERQAAAIKEKSERELRAERRQAMKAEKSAPLKPAVDPAKIAGAIKLGDFYFDRGEYDSAISEYQRGLSFDPANSTLSGRLDRAQKAKAAESRVLH
ncbi:MAG TPA: protein kinase [Terriglobia bacterium]|nr:protein kinase [Terriglobia bacterium]